MRKSIRAVALLLAAAVLPVVAVLPGSAAGAKSAIPLYTTPMGAPISSLGGWVMNPDWNGYLATGNKTTASFTQVSASFNVPSLNCATTPDGYVSHWAGLDGSGYNLKASPTLEAVGVTALCSGGTATYYGWWETYPDPQTDVMSLSPGDAIDIDVYYMPATHPTAPYLLTLSDPTTNLGFERTVACAAATCLNSSAEVITSAPSNAASTEASHLLPLANYGQVDYVDTAVEDHAIQFGGFNSPNWISHLMYTPAASRWVEVGATDVLYGGLAFFNLYPTTPSPSSHLTPRPVRTVAQATRAPAQVTRVAM